MNLLNPTNVWQAQNLPDGLSLNNGVISGTPTVTGSFSVPVTVSNPLGSDTKNISILVKYKPGTQKFSILQNGSEVAKLSIPELQAMVQDETAQSRFNCTNTQIVLPVLSPALKLEVTSQNYDKTSGIISHTYEYRPSAVEDVAINFCAFRDITLQDGSTRPGLFLQFDKTLWCRFAPFDTGDSVDAQPFNRWRYSNLRQWLNAEGLNWFTPAYNGDALVTWQEALEYEYRNYLNDPERLDYGLYYIQSKCAQSTYADSDVRGFLDSLPDDLHSILQPVKIITQAFFDENNSNLSIEDPEDVDGYDADITYDKVFIPSLKEMLLGFTDPYDESVATMQVIAQEGVEGDPWAFWNNKLSAVAYSTFGGEIYDQIKAHNGEWPYFIPKNEHVASYSPFLTTYPFLDEWGDSLFFPSSAGRYDRQSVLTRTAVDNSTYGIWSIDRWHYDHYNDDLEAHSTNHYANPAPAFVIC